MNDNKNNLKAERKPDARFIAVVVLCVIAIATFIASVVLSAIAIASYGKNTEKETVGAYERLAAEYKYNAVELRRGNTYGTAFVYTVEGSDMYLFTNYHVAGETGGSIELRFYGKSAFGNLGAVEVVGYDKEYAIALLKTGGYPNNPYVDLRKKNLVAQSANMGAEILCLGNNLGHGIQAQNGIVSNGSLVRSIKDDATGTEKVRAVIGACAPLNSGDSGAAVFDMNGRLIGMNTWKVLLNSSNESVDDVCYLTPAPIIAAAYENLVTRGQTGEIDFPVILWQSNGGAPVNSYGALFIHDMRAALSFVDSKLTVTSVDALCRDIEVGDVITQFGKVEVTENNFPSLIGELFNYNYVGGGEKLMLKVNRGGSEITVYIDNLKSVR